MSLNDRESQNKQDAWTIRTAALESVLGESDDRVLHAVRPFYLGGAADILCFHKHISGRVAVTCELLGVKEQIRNQLGNYELMVAHRDENNWGPNLISKLARYTCEKRLEPGHTMDIGPLAPKGSTIAALLFIDYARFIYDGHDAGLLLCIGITADELKACHAKRLPEILNALKAKGIYPYTDLFRVSVLL